MSSYENKLALQEYIDKNGLKSAATETHPILLKGERVILPVYSIPLDYLYFNIKNGRFKAEYLDYVINNGGKELDPENEADAIKIQELLLKLDPIETKRTFADIKDRGQWNPGIMTHDGFIIDGNRRLSILRSLAKDDSKFNKMRVAHLPSSVEKNDLWKLEAGIQLGKDEIVRYGPINELLKLKDGINTGLSTKEIADSLYGHKNDTEVKEKLERLELIKGYLKFIGAPEKYVDVEHKVEHFIYAQKILKNLDKKSDDINFKYKMKLAIYALIKDGRTHMDIRKVGDMYNAKSDKALTWVKEIAKISKSGSTQNVEQTKKSLDDHVQGIMDENLDLDTSDETMSNISTLWINATDEYQVKKNENNIKRLLDTILRNFDGLNYDHEQLQTGEHDETIKQIIHYADKLRTKMRT